MIFKVKYVVLTGTVSMAKVRSAALIAHTRIDTVYGALFFIPLLLPRKE